MKRFRSVKIASILGILGNLFLLIIKSFIGFSTKSQAMIADAFNSAGDIVSSVFTFIGNKVASVPKDDDHNLGHGKAEYIYSMLISIIMFYQLRKSQKSLKVIMLLLDYIFILKVYLLKLKKLSLLLGVNLK